MTLAYAWCCTAQRVTTFPRTKSYISQQIPAFFLQAYSRTEAEKMAREILGTAKNVEIHISVEELG